VSTELQLAARCTAQAIRLRQLEAELAEERTRVTLLRLQVDALERRRRELHRVLVARALRIQRLQSRLSHARHSRDLWRHRAMVAR